MYVYLYFCQVKNWFTCTRFFGNSLDSMNKQTHMIEAQKGFSQWNQNKGNNKITELRTI